MYTPSLSIDLRHLRYFLAVAEELHFGRAADRLHIAQPPLSQAIRKLEKELGVQLFHRTSRHVVVTEAGLVFAEEARKILVAFDVAVAEARHAGGANAVGRIGCSPFLAASRPQGVVSAIKQRDPRIRTSVAHLVPREQRRRLVSRELDVGIAQTPGDIPGFMTERIFAGEPLMACLPVDHHLTQNDTIRPADVVDEVQIVYPRDENPAIMERFYGPIAEAGYHFREHREAPGLSERDLLFAVAEGTGILLGTRSLTRMTE